MTGDRSQFAKATGTAATADGLRRKFAEGSKDFIPADRKFTNQSYNDPMDNVSRYELDAKLEAIEARMDARVGRIESAIEAMRSDVQQASAENSQTRSSISSLKTTIIITAVSTVVAIVLGMAAFNSTMLSNMLASFESGKNTASALEKTSSELKDIKDRLDKQIEQAQSAATATNK